MKTTSLKEIARVAFFILSVMAILLITGYNLAAQTVRQTPDGNYVSVSVKDTAASYKDTGKHYTDSRGNQYPVYVSAWFFTQFIQRDKNHAFR